MFTIEAITEVTILILIDGFLQSAHISIINEEEFSHNPYFNRWFSAMIDDNFSCPLSSSHNPYFNRWFSAIAAKIS